MSYGENYSENAQKVYERLYLARNREGKILESIDGCHDRVADFLANSGDEYNNFRRLLDEQRFRPNTPCMANAGIKKDPMMLACFPAGTLVRTIRGLEPIELISKKTKVLTHTGCYKEVKETNVRSYNGKLYSIKPTTVDSFETTNEHPIYVIPEENFNCHRAGKTRTCNPINNGKLSRCFSKEKSYKSNCEKLSKDFSNELIWKNAEDIEEGDHLIITFDNDTNDSILHQKIDLFKYLDHTWKKDEKHVWFREKYKTKRFVKVDEDFLLLLGYFAAEGTNTYASRTGFSFNAINENHYIDEVSRIFESATGILPKIGYNEKSGSISINICSKPFHLFIANEFGTSTCYDFNLPDWIMKLSPAYQKQFLIGFLRGDSHITTSGELSIGLSNKILAHQIWELFLRQGIITNKHEEIRIVEGREHTTYKISVKLDESHKNFVKKIWKNKIINLEKGDYSYRRGYFIDKNKIAVKIKEIQTRQAKDLYVYNLEVEKDHTYTIENIIVHNCFVLGLEDSMDSIIDMWGTAAKIYEGGGGCGIPITNLRRSGSPLTSGGFASGPLSYLNVIETISNTVKSGGKCLAPFQKVYSTQGIFEVQNLAKTGEVFNTVVFDREQNQKKIRKAIAYKSGRKVIYKIKTNRGEFFLSKDHPVVLASKELKAVKDLKAGNRLKAFRCSQRNDNYLTISKPKNENPLGDFSHLLHRLIARDILEWDIDNYIVHHIDDDIHNNEENNLKQMASNDHAYHHMQQLVSANKHVFQKRKFPKSAENNPMHRNSDFWKDDDRVENYKDKQSILLKKRGKQTILNMQNKAATKRMMNTAYFLINQGYDIYTIENYRKALIAENKSCEGKSTLLNRVENRFGSFENFLQEVNDNNHEVQSVEKVGMMNVYDVEIQCKPEDENEKALRNFPIIDNRTEEGALMGKGIFVSNSRRAANLIAARYDHPDIFEIINSKRGQDTFKSMNLSVSVDDKFMDAIYKQEKDRDPHYRQIDPNEGPLDLVRHKDVWDQICTAAWECGDPGLLFLDRVNEDNPLDISIECTNPCGESPLWSDFCCDLGHMNLNKYFNDWDQWNLFEDDIYWAVLFLNRIIEKSSYPNQKFKENMQKYRPIGLGIMGFADILYKKKIRYGSDESIELLDNITSFLTSNAYKSSSKLVEENKIPEIKLDKKIKLDKMIKRFSDIPANSAFPGNITVTTIAPTGSTAISADCSYSFEPHFALTWDKHLDGGGTMTFLNREFEKKLDTVLHCGRYARNKNDVINEIKRNKGTLKNTYFPEDYQWMRDVFVTAHDIPNEERIKMQAAAQKNITMAVSSTVNLPNSATVEDVANIYLDAWRKGLKGITVFRDGCLNEQPIDFGTDNCEEHDDMEEDEWIDKAEVKPKVVGHAEIRMNPIFGKRYKRPMERNGKVVEVNTPAGKLYVRGSFDQGKLMEVFLDVGQQGSRENVLFNGLGRVISRSLQRGVDLSDITDTLRGSGGDHFWIKLNSDEERSYPVEGILDAVATILDEKFSGEHIEGHITHIEQDETEKLERCPDCKKFTLRMDAGCRGGFCVNPDCGFSNCS